MRVPKGRMQARERAMIRKKVADYGHAEKSVTPGVFGADYHLVAERLGAFHELLNERAPTDFDQRLVEAHPAALSAREDGHAQFRDPLDGYGGHREI